MEVLLVLSSLVLFVLGCIGGFRVMYMLPAPVRRHPAILLNWTLVPIVVSLALMEALNVQIWSTFVLPLFLGLIVGLATAYYDRLKPVGW